MLQNVIEVDAEMRLASLNSDTAAAIFFDFAAAFPSLAHDFLHEVLRHLNLPESFCNFVRSLYVGNSCVIALSGAQARGFSIRAGIRKGCPLSPLLFAVCGDLRLRRLQRLLPELDLLRAYADDLAVVSRDLQASLGIFGKVFAEYARVSGLVLNLRKTVLIPLCDRLPAELSMLLECACPGWNAAHIRHWAE